MRPRHAAKTWVVSGVLFVAAALVLAWEIGLPEYYALRLDYADVRTDADAEDSGKCVLALGQMGDRSLRVVLPRLRANPFRATWEMLVLEEMGKPAHDELLRRIDRSGDLRERTGLIYALQRSFDDFSRVHLWVRDLHEWPGSANFLCIQLERHFRTSIPLKLNDQGTPAPDIAAWWAAREHQQ